MHHRDAHLFSTDSSSTPWKSHYTAQLDQFCNIALELPAIFDKVDCVLALPGTASRRMELHAILNSCLGLEGQFDRWLTQATMASADIRPAVWVDCNEGIMGENPFKNILTFRDQQTGLIMVYYWMCQLIFHGCIVSIHTALHQPVIGEYAHMWPGNPSTTPIDISLYQDSQELAANICRGLDALLNTTIQPDMLSAPITVVGDYYRELNTFSQACMLEALWLESFKNRLAVKGQQRRSNASQKATAF